MKQQTIYAAICLVLAIVWLIKTFMATNEEDAQHYSTVSSIYTAAAFIILSNS